MRSGGGLFRDNPVRYRSVLGILYEQEHPLMKIKIPGKNRNPTNLLIFRVSGYR